MVTTMKNTRYLILAAALLAAVCGCEKRLDTAPTDSVGSEQIFQSAESALAAVNGIYRCMYMADWGTAWNAENGGIMAYILASDLMGEDHIQNKAGSGWFYYDYSYGISSDYTYSYGRQGQCWNFFYTLISNANNIIANEGKIQDDHELADYVVGQAFAIRAYCYLWLVQNYQQCDPSLPGVPLYTESTTINSKGKGRGTVQDVYNLINADLDEALARLGGASGAVQLQAAQQQPQAQPVVQQHPSHIDYYVAQGIKARALLVQKDYQGAQAAAMIAMERPGLQILPFAETVKINDVSKKNVMWGLAIQSDQALGSNGVYAHIDADANTTYANGAQFLISSWLYSQIPSTDARLAWWTAPLPEGEWVEKSSKKSYVQVKMVFKEASLGTGDYILMRVEEMALIVAEAACHLGDYQTAREYVAMVSSMRDANWQEHLAAMSNGSDYNSNTVSTVNNLMDYILLQRRIELWGEVSRMHDLQRLGLGVDRTYSYPDNNHSSQKKYPAGDKRFIYAIPLNEFDGNTALNPVTDQNPL